VLVPLTFARHVLGLTATSTDRVNWRLEFFERKASFQIGSLQAQGPEGPLTLPTAPVMLSGEVYVPGELLTAAWGWQLTSASTPQGLATLQVVAPGANVAEARVGEQSDCSRLVLELDGASAFSWHFFGDSLELCLPPVAGAMPRHQMSLQGYDLKHLRSVSRETTEEGGTLVDINLSQAGEPQVFTLANPARIVIDVPGIAAPATPAPGTVITPAPLSPPVAVKLPPGAPRWQVKQITGPRGPLTLYTLKFDPRNSPWVLKPVLAGTTLQRHRSVGRIVDREGGAAGINAGFFAGSGPAVGLLAIDGEWMCTPAHSAQRTSLLIGKSGEVRMGRWLFQGRVTFGGRKSLPVTDLNRGHYDGDELVVYTRRWGETVDGSDLYTRLIVSDQNLVFARETAGQGTVIPERGYVVSGRGRYAELLREIPVGETVKLELGTKPDLPEVWSLLEAGPRLVVDGQTCNYADVECFKSDVCALGSRSAVGITKRGEVLLVAVETPGTDRGGLFLDEMAKLLKQLGAYQAMNLDGGGSTQVAQGGEILNRVHDDPRPVSTALVVVPRTPGS
jgi:hypothetical protein